MKNHNENIAANAYSPFVCTFLYKESFCDILRYAEKNPFKNELVDLMQAELGLPDHLFSEMVSHIKNKNPSVAGDAVLLMEELQALMPIIDAAKDYIFEKYG